MSHTQKYANNAIPISAWPQPQPSLDSPQPQPGARLFAHPVLHLNRHDRGTMRKADLKASFSHLDYGYGQFLQD